MKAWMLGGVMLVACSSEAPQAKPAPEPVAQEIAVAPMPEVPPPSGSAKPEPAPEPAPEPQEAPARGVLGSAALAEGGAFATITGTGDLSAGFDDAEIMGGLLGNEPSEPLGGFGYADRSFGPGEGGTGWGTIGTGRYGTITGGQNVSGYGSGNAGMRGRAASVPQLRLGQATCVGELDKAIVRRYIKRQALKLSYCYEKQLLARPGLEGTVATHFIIGADGAVATAQATGVDPAVSTCVAAVLKDIQFPKPKSAGVSCSYPFSFRPTGG